MAKPILEFYDVSSRKKLRTSDYQIVKTKNGRFRAVHRKGNGKQVSRFVSEDFVRGNGLFDFFTKPMKNTVDNLPMFFKDPNKLSAKEKKKMEQLFKRSRGKIGGK